MKKINKKMKIALLFALFLAVSVSFVCCGKSFSSPTYTGAAYTIKM